MRTTVTLDERNAERLQRAMREKRLGFKEALNQALELGLKEMMGGKGKRVVKTPTWAMSDPPGANYDKALSLADALEDDELERKIELGK